MSQMTIRLQDPELEREIDRLAQAEGISRNRAVLLLLRKAAGLHASMANEHIGNALDDFVGDLTVDEASRIERATADFSIVDEDLWKK